MSDLVEQVARAIAAHKRRLPPDHPEIDRVWSSYCGQVRAALSVIEGRVRAEEREARALIQAIDDAGRLPSGRGSSKWIVIPASLFARVQMFAAAIRSGDAG